MIVGYGIKKESDHKTYESPLDDGQIVICREWLKKYAKSKNVKKYDCINSYGLKNKIENDAREYITNGACIQAAMDLGFRYWVGEDSVNANFYMQLLLPEDDWKRIRACGFSRWLFEQIDYRLSASAKHDSDWPRKASTFLDFWQYLNRWPNILNEFYDLWEQWSGKPAPRPEQVNTDSVYQEECPFVSRGERYSQADEGFTFLYALVEKEPVHERIKVKYVGQTRDPVIRLRDHILKPGTLERVKWIGHLLTEGRFPSMAIFDTVPISEADQKEKAAIYAFANCETSWDKENNRFRPLDEALLNENYN